MTAIPRLMNASLDRMVLAVEQVRERLRKATATLEAAGIPYAVIGGNAVATWVSDVDVAAVRNTRDVDILLRRADLPAATAAMEAAGFVYRHARGIDMFLDGPCGKARDAVHLIFADEKVRADDPVPAPSIDEVRIADDYRVASLEALVRMKLVAWRDKDRTHLRDLIELELLDESWPARYVPELAERLQSLLDDPDG